MKIRSFLILGLSVIFLSFNTICSAGQTIIARKTAQAPVIDGIANDAAWAQAQPIITHDNTANIDMTLKAVYTDTEIFFLVEFADPEASLTHRTWMWDKTEEIYRVGPDREDTFVFKWNMEDHPVDLSLKTNNSYMADIWFWKACRTDPVGYADDKYQRFSNSEMPKSNIINLESGKKMYLIRKGDSGTPAFKENIYGEYAGEKTACYTNVVPTGSLADIKAKGVWSGGKWTIEFKRVLDTKHEDDVQFDIAKTYLFGVSRHEIAGRPADPKLEQPLYGAGDISEELTLQFAQ